MGEFKQGMEKLEADLVALKDHVQLSKYVALATVSADPSQPATSLMHVRLQENLANVQSFARYLWRDRKSTRLNSSHLVISYAVFCLKKKTNIHASRHWLQQHLVR